MRQRWRATWLVGDVLYEFLFDSVSQIYIARIDLALKLLGVSTFPEKYILTEASGSGTDMAPHPAWEVVE